MLSFWVKEIQNVLRIHLHLVTGHRQGAITFLNFLRRMNCWCYYPWPSPQQRHAIWNAIQAQNPAENGSMSPLDDLKTGLRQRNGNPVACHINEFTAINPAASSQSHLSNS